MGATIQLKDGTLGPFFNLTRFGGLKVKISGGKLDDANAPINVSAKIINLTGNATNYIFIDATTKEIAVNTTGAISKRDKVLWELITDATDIIDEIDQRGVFRMSAHSMAETRTYWLLNQTFNSDTGWTLFDLSSEAPKGATVVKIDIYLFDTGVKGNNVWFGVRNPDESELSRQKRTWPLGNGEYHEALGIQVGLDTNQRIEYRAMPSGDMTVYIALAGWEFG